MEGNFGGCKVTLAKWQRKHCWSNNLWQFHDDSLIKRIQNKFEYTPASKFPMHNLHMFACQLSDVRWAPQMVVLFFCRVFVPNSPILVPSKVSLHTVCNIYNMIHIAYIIKYMKQKDSFINSCNKATYKYPIINIIILKILPLS